jgi:valyl-tRNA synthetase
LRATTEADAAGAADEPVPDVLAVAAAVLGEVRRAKSEAKRSMRAPVASVTVTDTADRLALLALAAADVRSAGNVASLDTVEGDAFSVGVTLASNQ